MFNVLSVLSTLVAIASPFLDPFGSNYQVPLESCSHRCRRLVSVYVCAYTTHMRDEHDFTKARRGPVVPLAPGKTRITIRIDDDILDWFREQVEQAGGGNYQTLINDTLRQAISAKQESLERVVRRVVREELARGKGPKRGSQR